MVNGYSKMLGRCRGSVQVHEKQQEGGVEFPQAALLQAGLPSLKVPGGLTLHLLGQSPVQARRCECLGRTGIHIQFKESKQMPGQRVTLDFTQIS